MSKIIRKNQKIFSGDTPASSVISQFGSLKIALPTYSLDPDVLQGLNAWGEGWASGVINQYNPTIQDLNTLFFVLTRQVAYIMQSGIPEWNATTPYYIGSMVSDGLGTIYKSVSDTNVGAALTDNTKWLNYKSITINDIGDNYTVLNSDYMIRWSLGATSSGHQTITLPSPSASLKGREIIVKAISATGSYPLLIQAFDSSTINNEAHSHAAQYEARRFICDGVKWNCLADFS